MRFFIDTGSVAEVEEIAAWGILSGRDHEPVAARQGAGRPRRHRAPDLRPRGRARERRGGLGRRRRHDRRGPRAGGPARARGREGAVLERGPARHARAHRRGHPRQHDARLLREPGAADRPGGRDLRVLLHGPARRHLDRLDRRRGARSSRRSGPAGRRPRCWPPRSATPSTSSPRRGSDARSRPCRPRSSVRCSTTRSPRAAASGSRATGSRGPSSASGFVSWFRSSRRRRSELAGRPLPRPDRSSGYGGPSAAEAARGAAARGRGRFAGRARRVGRWRTCTRSRVSTASRATGCCARTS